MPIFGNLERIKINLMIYLLVDLKIVLALHPSDQNRG